MNHRVQIMRKALGLCILVMLYGCERKVQRDFFVDMKSKYPDIKIDSSFFYIKSFGLSDSSQKIGSHSYWKLKADKNAEFFLSGYLRKVNDSIMVVPYDYRESKGSVKEYKLFDFKAKPGDSWNALLETNGNILFGDSIVFQRTEMLAKQEIYVYSLYPYHFFSKDSSKDFKAGSFEVGVSKNKGIVSIKSLVQGIKVDTLFKALLYPKVRFTNNKANTLAL